MAQHDGEQHDGPAANDLIYGIDDVPPLREGLALGLQHYLTMFGSTVAIPFIMAGPLGIANEPGKLAVLIATMFFVSGITTLLQTTIGNRLPIIQGGTFSILTPAIVVVGMAAANGAGFEVRMQHLQGAIILGAVFEALIGLTGLAGKLLRFITPVSIAPTIALIGLALYKFGAPTAGADWVLGGATIVFIILFSQVLRRTHRVFELFPILLAILCAWLLAFILTETGVYTKGDPGFVSFATVGTSDWLAVPMPFPYGWPEFGLAAFVAMVAGFLASIIESIGDYYACARLSGAPVPNKRTINRGIATEGIGSVFAGIMGTGNATTSYSENIGAIGLTRVGSRRVVQIGAIMMIVLGAFPKFGALFTAIPGPIVGGMYCALFGMIASVGLSNLQFVDLNSARNLFIIGFSFFMGLSLPEYFNAVSCVPAEGGKLCTEGINLLAFDSAPWLADILNTIGRSGMAVGAILAVLLDNIIPGTDEECGRRHMMG